MKWQPIETAPKDELILITDGVDVAPGWWTGEIKYPWAFIDDTRWDAGECEDEKGLIAPNGYPEKYITHWMPLPEPPTEIDEFDEIETPAGQMPHKGAR